MRFSWICSAITTVTSHSTRRSKTASGRTSHASWRPWGKNDPFFLPRGAEAFRRDIPDAIVHFFDTGHFALETHAKEIAAVIRGFFAR
jgi:pimeloyl-ACP methyl ester carboxylesterase